MIGLIRRFYLVVLLVLALAVPYALVGDSTGPIRDKIRGMFASRASDPDPIEGIDDPEVNRLLAMQRQLSTTGRAETVTSKLTPTVNLEGVLRFDVDPRWVMQHWPHVSTTRIDGPLDGLRVPLITGTTPQDVVGSLTYYFNEQQQVQRISMDGFMGDDRRMVAVVTKVFQLKPEPRAGVGVYVSKWNGKPISALWVRRMPVVHTGNGAQQYEFALEINRPNSSPALSPRLQQRIQNAHAGRASANMVR